MADKAFWAHYALEVFAGKPEEKDIRGLHGTLKEIVPDTKNLHLLDTGQAKKVSSGKTMTTEHPLDGTVTEKRKKISHASDYSPNIFVRALFSACD